jgi:hypothetical protein
VYESFLKAIQWKTRNSDMQEHAAQAQLCSALFAYKQKCFLVDFAGVDPNGITVEAFRTTKELLSLISKDKPYYMTLWTNDINEANEIAYHVQSPNIIWVNDYGVFEGPAVSSQAFYGGYNIVQNVCNSVLKIHEAWVKRPFEDRYQTVHSELLKYVAEKVKSEDHFVISMLEALTDWNGDDIVRYHNDRLCICRTVPVPCLKYIGELDCAYEEIAKLFVIGTPQVTKDKKYEDLFTFLAASGVPVSMDKHLKLANLPVTQIKVIHSNHGTIFAN